MILQQSEQVDEVAVTEGREYVLLGLMVPVVGLDHGEVAMVLDPSVNGPVNSLHPDLANWETVEYAQKSDESEKEELNKDKSEYFLFRFYFILF